MSTPCEPEQEANTDNHVERVHAGHREIEEEEDLRLLRHVRRKRLLFQAIRVRIDELRDIKVSAWNMVLLPLLVVLVVLDAKEHQPEYRREDEEDNKQTPLPDLSSPDTQRHKKAGADQHSRIRRAQRNTELVRCNDKGIVVPVAIQQVREEQSTEEHDFGQQEEPHPEGASFPLLLFRLKVMPVLRQSDVLMLRCDGRLVRMWMCSYDRIIQRSSPLVPSCGRATRSHRPHDRR